MSDPETTALGGRALTRASDANDAVADAVTMSDGPPGGRRALGGATPAAPAGAGQRGQRLGAEQCDARLCVAYFEDAADPHTLHVAAKNRSYYDLDVRLTLDLENMRPSERRPQAVLSPRMADYETMVTFERVDPARGYRYGFRSTHYPGNPDATPDGTLYELPFAEGESYEVGQGFNGARSHGGASRFAVDFTMPNGSVVAAARKGVVVELKNDSTVVGSDDPDDKDDGNFVRVRHDDGTYAVYGHLERASVSVGDSVTAGQEIGRSNNTGYSTGPHLHFHVEVADRNPSRGGKRGFHTVRYQFKKPDGTAFVPQAGQTYGR